MPFVERSDARLYYEVRGQGSPLLLIMGVGGNIRWWGTGFLRRLAEKHTVIAFDNRGAGQSEADPKSGWTLEQMADDARAVLAAAGVERAHVLGYSMGGMIAQELALRHPEAVASLVLGATSCGGPQMIQSDDIKREMRSRPAEVAERAAWYMRLFFPEAFRAKNEAYLQSAFRLLLRADMPEAVYQAQLDAVDRWQGSWERLTRLSCPALVMHGLEDRVLPYVNGERLAYRLAGSRLKLYAGCGHGFAMQAGGAVLRDVLAFLDTGEDGALGAG
ncbi:alpha/beta fold hydrolase [Alicyclobacillus sendaiensis]|uniref:Alpha/beta hydrolase n=1 Tax=Alicyclobacillus sendaiensis PA2 TaxID=3029425 RepID=A0ABT6XWU8_ALISE|nr:alpha/beta hydrolase [Alicyclobacillus sendaiensis]MDI9259572.1 alpha/beta hydrolase [Alicyclobacillus sendaiensis PA2]